MQLKRMSNSKLFHSFFLFFFFISFASSSFNNTHKCKAEESVALLLFKENLFSINDTTYAWECQDQLSSRYYPLMMNWNKSADCCTWNGVTCNHFTGDVVALDLNCGMLRGTIKPNTTLFRLPHLQRLNLAYNVFTASQLPHEIGRLSNSLTHLNISRCGFTGQIPSDISLLHKLVSLDLSWNGLRLEPQVFYNLLQNSTLLKELSLASVNISSVLPTYLNISSLKSSNLCSTGLRGNLPHTIFNLQYLEKLDLSSNYGLTGPFPNVSKSVYNPLNTLRLSSCNLMGSLPNSLVNLRHLVALDLSSNLLNGTLPSWLFTLPSLEIIHINNNMFSGSLPSELFNRRSLKELSLGNNRLVGEIDLLDQLSFLQLNNLTYLNLAFNNFTGVWELDTLLSSLPNLTYLLLSYSGLSVVTSNANHYVNPDFRYLSLASCKLTLFPESLRAMKNLERLDLSSNEIHGHIPDWAREIGGNHLFYLNISHNFITGLPRFQWDGLQYLYLDSNQIQGPFPPSICNMSSLLFLDMSNNSFSGVIPQCFGHIMSSSLWMVDLGHNSFRGTIPNAYEDCIQLEGIVLNGNQLEGEVPSFLSRCRFLKVVDIGNNYLTGMFPGWLGDLPNLQVVILASNNLQGPIEISSTIQHPFPSLKVLGLSHNGFAGHLPQKYFQIFNAMKNVARTGTKPQYVSMGGVYYSIEVVVKDSRLVFPKISVDYTIVDLSCNRFEGEIPDVIGSLNSLIVLNLSHNSLNGGIPNALGNLSQIESLDLSWNQLIGRIPQSLADITYLAVLNLSQNRLEGRIPHGTQFSTFENSFAGNPMLCGLPLPKKCELPPKPQVEADGDMESGFTWKAVMLGYGCGTLLGIGIGYLMLSTGRPKWFNAIADAAEHIIQTRLNMRKYILYAGK